MATAVLSRRVEKVVGYPPLSEMSDQQRREFHEAEGHAMLASHLFNATPDAIEPSRVIELLRDAVKEVADLGGINPAWLREGLTASASWQGRRQWPTA